MHIDVITKESGHFQCCYTLADTLLAYDKTSSSLLFQVGKLTIHKFRKCQNPRHLLFNLIALWQISQLLLTSYSFSDCALYFFSCLLHFVLHKSSLLQRQTQLLKLPFPVPLIPKPSQKTT